MITIHIISDSLGNTAKDITKAALVQFDYKNVEYKLLKNANTKSLENIDNILKNVSSNDVIITTLVDKNLATYTKSVAKKNNIKIIDLFSPLLEAFEEKFNVVRENKAGLSRKMSVEYFKRIEAIEFAVKYDDGKDVNGILQADIILLGVSRTSKTPLSLYLANKNIKVLNIPIVKGVVLPEELYKIDRRKIVGLTNSVEKLNSLRTERIKSLGIFSNTDYTDEVQIFEELEYGLSLMENLGCPIINVENKAIEETAEIIINLIAERNLKI